MGIIMPISWALLVSVDIAWTRSDLEGLIIIRCAIDGRAGLGCELCSLQCQEH